MAIPANQENESSLAARLRARIEREGPITFCDWMQAALYDERHGYYCRPGQIRQGRAGDYRTAPETSPLFAATFASYFSKLFADFLFELGPTPAWSIFEAGAGGGEFAHGVLTNLSENYPEVFAATTYVIDEVSPAERRRASERLAEFGDRVRFRRFDEINNPAIAGVVFSNELIDAFPVHRVIMRHGRLCELFVGLERNAFIWVERDPVSGVAEYCRGIALELCEGQIAEINLAAAGFISRSAGLLERGFVVTVDYGDERRDLLETPDRFHGTLRAFHRHHLTDNILGKPGEQDLTTTVDWTQIKEAGRLAGLQAIRFERLDQFLLTEGLLGHMSRMATRVRDAADSVRLNVSSRELIMPNGLAASFQVLVQKKCA
jgi:SAM-dependent MidA family methyltransferase